MKQMKDCVVTLPITPIDNPSIGLMVIPFLMDALSKRMGIDSLLALNVNGAKLYNDSIEKNVNGYLSSIKKMGIFCNFIWKDDQGENIFWINKFFNQLRKEKYIIQERTIIMKCECGLVESIAEAENLFLSRRVYSTKENKKYCKVCETEIVESEELAYLFKFPNIISVKNIYPEFYKKELLIMSKRFSGYKFLISRSRSSALAIWSGDKNIYLDIDFVWQMYLPTIRRLRWTGLSRQEN